MNNIELLILLRDRAIKKIGDMLIKEDYSRILKEINRLFIDEISRIDKQNDNTLS